MLIDTIVFDLNGTLLDLSALDPFFVHVTPDSAAPQRWFSKLQVLWMTSIATGDYQPFDVLAKSALEMVAAGSGISISKADETAILAQLSKLPPFPEVAEGLRLLQASGRKLAVLTNGSRVTSSKMLDIAGLSSFISEVISIDEVRRYKPAPEPYYHVASRLHVALDQILLVSAHAWDIYGAAHVGLRTAFLKRPGQALNPTAAPPDFTANDLTDLARQLPPL